MSYFEHFFTIPTVHIDGDYEMTKEERNEKMGAGDIEFNPEYLICETDIAPDDEVVFITDAWYPSEGGFESARDNNKFTCCRVTFMNAGTFLVAWPKKRFRKIYSDFKDGLPQMEIIQLEGKEQIEEFLNKLKDADTERKE